MNTQITLKNIASYKVEATLNTDKKINLIYGLNGTGKTILSNYLYSKKNNIKQNGDFPDCKDNFDNNTKILVYNEQFIKDNFQQTIPGIFTLSAQNKKIEENIQEAKNKLNELEQKKTRIKRRSRRLKKEF